MNREDGRFNHSISEIHVTTNKGEKIMLAMMGKILYAPVKEPKQ